MSGTAQEAVVALSRTAAQLLVDDVEAAARGDAMLGRPMPHPYPHLDRNRVLRVCAEHAEMLAALRMVTEACGPHTYWNGDTRSFLIAAEKAIAKAEGRA